MSLRQKLFIALTLAAILPLIGVAAFVMVTIKEHDQHHISRQLQQQVSNTAIKLSGKIQGYKQEIKALSQLPTLRSGNFKEARRFLIDYLKQANVPYEKFIIGDLQGHFYNTSGGNPNQGMLRTFDDSNAQAKPKSIKSRDYWQNTVGENKEKSLDVYVSNPMISYTTGVKQVVIAVPIRDENTQIIGLLGGALSWQIFDRWLFELESDLNVPDTESIRFMLISNDGTYWYHWDQQKVINVEKNNLGQPVLDEKGEAVVSSFNILNDANQQIKQVGAEMVEGKFSSVLVDTDVKKELWFYGPVSSAQFSIALVVDESSVNQLSKTVFLQVTSIFIVAIMFVALITIYLSEQLSFPIKRLAMRLKKIMRQELEFRESIQDLIADKETRKLVLACLETLKSDNRRKKDKDHES